MELLFILHEFLVHILNQKDKQSSNIKKNVTIFRKCKIFIEILKDSIPSKYNNVKTFNVRDPIE